MNMFTVLRPMNDNEIQYWYKAELEAAFDPQERKPLPDIFRLRDAGCYDLLGLFGRGAEKDAEQMLGYATIWKSPSIELMLLDYLGVSSMLRNNGLGSYILNSLKEYYHGRRIIVESELPIPGGDPKENSIRERRIAFYQRNGFVPVYEMATCGLRWQALLLGVVPEHGSDEMAAIMAEHKALYGPLRTDVKVPLGLDEIPTMPYWMNASPPTC